MNDGSIVGEVVVATRWYSLRQVCEICGIEAVLVWEMAEHGVIDPPGDQPDAWSFSEFDLLRFKEAIRLRNDLGIDWAGTFLPKHRVGNPGGFTELFVRIRRGVYCLK